jgi:N-6 DNA Methylase/Eco57I restriction-modification methylase
MLPGCDGHLVSAVFLERQSAELAEVAWLAQRRRRLSEWIAMARVLGPASTPAAMLHTSAVPLVELLGFHMPERVEQLDSVIVATLGSSVSPVAIIVTPWAEPLDPLWRLAVTQALQRCAVWCVLFDGLRLRLIDASRLYARRYVEFDLDLVIDHPIAFAAFWRVFSAASLTADPGDSSSLHALVAASDRHAAGVCLSLRDGVLDASAHVLRALLVNGRRKRRRSPDAKAAFEQALTIVYRMLFLLFAEARSLVPLWHPVYRDSYSLEALRELADDPAFAHRAGVELPPSPAGCSFGFGGTRRRGRPQAAVAFWDALRAIAHLAHAGCRAGDLRVTPFNGRLFAPARTPLAERRDLDDESARQAVRALSSRPTPDRAGRERIAYRDLGVEQLGAVYETLLDYEPTGNGEAVRLECGSGIRKATGTFYTPQPIADYLVRRTLAPLVRDAAPEQILELRVVDPAMGSGAFLVAGCRYLAAAYESALVRSGSCHASDLGPSERSAVRRTIAERCLYGVDRNPMAVQLGRLSLWLATLAADRPLSFLDHRLQVGDSLLGAWVANLRHPPTKARRGELPLFGDEEVAGALRDALPVRFSLESTPNDTLDQVRAKERAFASLTDRDARLSRWKRVADLWCTAWFRTENTPPPAAFGALSDAVLKGRGSLPAALTDRFLATVDDVAASQRFFHWELEFPEVFFDRDGARLPAAGFDAVIGNPPWDMVRADSGNADSRAIARRDVASVLRFTRDAGVYRAQSGGHANRYQLFLERAIALTRHGGRIGLVLPSGLATDHGSAPLRQLLLSRCDLDALVGIDNHRGIFPIHRSVGFLLVTASPGSPTRRVACRFGIEDPAVLESIGEEASETSAWFPVQVSPALLERISGSSLAIPALRSAADLRIVDRASALFSPLGSPRGWAAQFGRELNASDDRAALRAPGHGMPVVEGKHLDPFRISLDRVRYSIRPADARRLLRSDRHQRPRLAYRDVAGSTNRTTLIAAILPAGTTSTHTVFCLRTPLPLRAQCFLCALFNSFVVNYFVRLRVTTHVTTATVEQLPIPTAEAAPSAFKEIAALGRLLTKRFDREAFAILNARVAALYQLSADEFHHILDTFPLVAVEERDAAFRSFTSGRWR